MRLVVTGFLVAVGIALFLSLQFTAKATTQKEVEASPYLLERVASNNWLLIDVRSPEEYADGHIPGAINMPHENINGYLSKLEQHKNKPIIIYCRSGRRAKLAMKVLQEHDFTDVMHLEGDILGWNETGLALEQM
ncbi:rhodanese-like domain-containing protein [Alteromonas sp. MB-3u-76]|uniref:rhodanese-like domain-containing protein n=1 Tax=Alteromonas sp. MB-3u-76 TaxID=2058133 RepID=UPI000C303171|nr:rhodanese-like domain-containing protein [Alteromonas sp. MB-3u-76]AUC89362.1 rhodanese-like domain-containing protein [Alteromonas sp. MB-3u-76]